MKIITQKDNKLLERKEIAAHLISETIPNKVEVIKQMAEKLKKPNENIVISKIESQFGNHTFKISAKIYNDPNSKNKYETISRKERKKRLEEEKKAKESTKVVEEKPEEMPIKQLASSDSPDNEIDEKPKSEESKT